MGGQHIHIKQWMRLYKSSLPAPVTWRYTSSRAVTRITRRWSALMRACPRGAWARGSKYQYIVASLHNPGKDHNMIDRQGLLIRVGLSLSHMQLHTRSRPYSYRTYHAPYRTVRVLRYEATTKYWMTVIVSSLQRCAPALPAEDGFDDHDAAFEVPPRLECRIPRPELHAHFVDLTCRMYGMLLNMRKHRNKHNNTACGMRGLRPRDRHEEHASVS